MRALLAVLLAATLLPACDDGVSTTNVRLELYAPYEGKSNGVQDVLEAAGGADLIELVALRASDPFGTQITVDLDLARGEGRLPALPFADDYWFFVRGFERGDAENVPLFFGAAAQVKVTEGTPLVVALQAGRADCIGLNRSSQAGRHADGTDDMGGRRVGATLTELPDGRVLVVGGATIGSNGEVTEVHDSMEIYDPASGQFVPLDLRLETPRAWHTATLLADGRVLVVGGQTGPGSADAPAPVTAAAVLLDLGINTSARVVSEGLPEGDARAHHAATRLNDGRGTVLISGGVGPDGAELSSVYRYFAPEAFEAGEGRLVRQGALWVPRAFHSQSRLIRNPDLALVAGGLSDTGVQASVEVFTLREGQEGCADPEQRPTADVGCFVRLPQSLWLSEARWGHAAVEVEGGRQILFAGGYSADDRSAFASSLELIDDQLQRVVAGALPTGRGELSATLLPDDSVLLLGGRRGDSPVAVSERLRPRREGDRVVQYDIGELSAECELSEPRFGHAAVRLRTGVVLVGGGVTGVRGALLPSRRGELYFPRIRDIDRVYPRAR